FFALDIERRAALYELDASYTWSLRFGGYAGLAHTDAHYSGSDCGDASTATAGCDGGLFLNNNITASRNSWEPFGGIRGSISLFAFCRSNPAGGAALARLEDLRNSCVEFLLSGETGIYPGARINHPGAIGGGPVNLSNGWTNPRRVRFGVRLRF
ncbi:MAG: hypothetical protein GY948_02055, partial [Alphaproteobacteria bacterium]|nr:hypothetical protein [Alphaproteobacteria bacterium]